jgi:hypothetical protein
MKPIRLIAACMVFALSLGGATSPARGAPGSKPSTSTTDLSEALKTMRPISVPLLEIDEVQTELKLSAEQKQAIADLTKAARDEFQAGLQQPMPIPAVGAGGGVAVRAFTSRAIKYDTEKMAAALKPDQLIRLRQLELHLKGPQVFADRRVARVLNLTAEQDLKIEEIIMRYEPTYTETMINARLNNLDGKPVAELGDKFVGECLKLLTKEQKASWDWLVGKRPEAGSWAKAVLPSPAGGFGGFAPAIGIQGGGVIRLAPLAPAAPAIPAPPKKEDK